MRDFSNLVTKIDLSPFVFEDASGHVYLQSYFKNKKEKLLFKWSFSYVIQNDRIIDMNKSAFKIYTYCCRILIRFLVI